MGQKGITLIELIVVMAIAGIIGWLVVSSFINLNDTLFDQEKTVDLQSAGRETIDRMVRVLREAGLNPLEDEDINGIEEATTSKLRVVLDRNLNGEIDEGAEERVTFKFENGSLWRCFDEGSAAEHCAEMNDTVEELTFSYDPPPPAAVQAIEIKLSLRVDKAKKRGDINRVFTTTVRGRNL